MQLDPIKPKLNPPRTKRLKVNYDAPLPIFAFNFNLRRYMKAGTTPGYLASFQKANETLDRIQKNLEAGAYTRPHFGST